LPATKYFNIYTGNNKTGSTAHGNGKHVPVACLPKADASSSTGLVPAYCPVPTVVVVVAHCPAGIACGLRSATYV